MLLTISPLLDLGKKHMPKNMGIHGCFSLPGRYFVLFTAAWCVHLRCRRWWRTCLPVHGGNGFRTSWGKVMVRVSGVCTRAFGDTDLEHLWTVVVCETSNHKLTTEYSECRAWAEIMNAKSTKFWSRNSTSCVWGIEYKPAGLRLF